MRAPFPLAVVVLSLLALVRPADAISKRACRRSCDSLIAAQCDGLGRKSFKRCRHDLVRLCRRQGTAACATTTSTPTTSTTTTTFATPHCGPTQKDCGTFCCNAADAVCAPNGEAYCCTPAFPVYCPDTGHGRFCCQDGFVCGGDGGCAVP